MYSVNTCTCIRTVVQRTCTCTCVCKVITPFVNKKATLREKKGEAQREEGIEPCSSQLSTPNS